MRCFVWSNARRYRQRCTAKSKAFLVQTVQGCAFVYLISPCGFSYLIALSTTCCTHLVPERPASVQKKSYQHRQPQYNRNRTGIVCLSTKARGAAYPTSVPGHRVAAYGAWYYPRHIAATSWYQHTLSQYQTSRRARLG
eukprot:2099786-Rhodomonas_salina.1